MNSLYIPLLGQVLLTLLVWFALVLYRVYVLQVRKIAPQVVADEAKNQEIYKSGRHLSDNFENLFEVPVLFYVGILASIQLGVTDQTQVYLAWGFVGLRWAHSLVHLSINHISTRFGCYALSTLFCLAIWVRIASHLGQS
jgi:hypothetical protein